MDLLNRYLNAVAILLPSKEREDIVAELRETLLSSIEERQGELKHVLSTDDMVALLKAYGHPFAVARRYRTSAPLIGAGMHPVYVLALQVTLGVALLAHLIWAGFALALGEAPGRVASFLFGSAWIVGMYLVGVCTFSFWVLDRASAWLARQGAGRWLERAWTPRHLPPASALRVNAWAQLLYELFFLVVVLLWAVGAGLWPALQPAPGQGSLAWLAPAWMRLGQLLIAIALAQLMVHALGAARPDWVRARTAADMLVKASALAAVTWFVLQRPWFDASASPDAAARMTASLDAAITLGLAPLAVLAAAGLVRDAGLLARSGRRAPASSVSR